MRDSIISKFNKDSYMPVDEKAEDNWGVRIKLMTKMASFEKNEGKRSMSIGTYFRGDYIGKEIIKSIVYGTVAFAIVFGMYIAYDFEFFMQDIYKMDLLEFGKAAAGYYFKFIIAYAIITYIVYALRYQGARRNLRAYYNNLKRLNAIYKAEDKAKTRAKEMRRARRTGSRNIKR